MTFSSKLQKLRKDNNLSQEQLASELCVSRQAISKWELGTLPDINNLVKVSNFFNCSLDYLMNDDKEDQFEEEFSNEQNKIANNENVGTKSHCNQKASQIHIIWIWNGYFDYFPYTNKININIFFQLHCQTGRIWNLVYRFYRIHRLL